MKIIPQLAAFSQLFDRLNNAGLYSMPDLGFQDDYRFHPKVRLTFYQTRSEAGEGLPFATGEISYKIMSETPETFTPANAKVRAERIKSLFVEPELFVWQKGKLSVTYLDKRQGYDFRLRVKTEAEAMRIITQVMAIENKTPNWELLCTHRTERQFPENPGTHRVYGETRRKFRRRPLEDIKFRYAEVTIPGMPNAETLIDTTGCRGSSLVYAMHDSW